MDSIGGYRVLGRLGAGGAGAVYRCQDASTGRVLAVKVLARGALATTQQRERFRREALALAKLRHPNVLAVYSAGDEDGALFLATAFHEGGSLSEKLREGPLETAEAARIGLGLAKGLAASHAAGILHRDLKPDNVLFDERGEPLLCDFGLAKDLSPESRRQSLTQSGALIGTPGFWAPEQAGGKEDTGSPTDVFGLGATLYAALTGHPPFRGDTVLEVLNATHTNSIESIERIRSDLPPHLSTLVMSCLTHDPERRPRLSEVERALRLILAEHAHGVRRRTRRWRPSSRALGGLIALSLAAAGGIGLASRGEPAPSQTPVASALESPTPEPSEPPRTPDFLRDQELPRLSAPGARFVRFVQGRRYLLTFDREHDHEVAIRRWDLRQGALCPDPPLQIRAQSSGHEHFHVPSRGSRFFDWVGSELGVHLVSPQGVQSRAIGFEGAELQALTSGASGVPVLVGSGHEVRLLDDSRSRLLFRRTGLRKIQHLVLSPAGSALAVGGELAPPKIGYRLQLLRYPSGEALPDVEPLDFQRWPRLIRFLPGEEPRVLIDDRLSVTLYSRRGLEVIGPSDSLGMARPLHPSGVASFVILEDEHFLSLARPIPGFKTYDLALWNVTRRRLVLRFLERDHPRYIDLCVDAEREWIALLAEDGEIEFWPRSRFLPK